LYEHLEKEFIKVEILSRSEKSGAP